MKPYIAPPRASQPRTALPDMSAVKVAVQNGTKRRERIKLSPPLGLVYVLWFIVLFDPQFWVAGIGIRVFLQVPLLLFLCLGGLVFLSGAHRGYYLLFLLFFANALITVPMADNPLMAWEATRRIMLYYILAVGTLQFVTKPVEFVPIILMHLWQYLWWAFHSGTMGLVPWHPTLGNFDGYGPLAVMGMVFCYHYAVGARDKKTKLIAYLLAGFSVLGVVASFARGAVLAAGAIGVMTWFRSPKKVAFAGYAAVGLVVVVVGAQTLFPQGAFFDEIKSAFTEGTEEGTGNDRWELWKAGMLVFIRNPIVGAGANNFGVEAAQIIRPGELGSRYANNPMALYGRQLHNIHMQVLSEFGLLGISLMWVLLFDFYRRNKEMRSEKAREWADSNLPRAPDIKSLALATEGAMVAYLLTGLFYDQLYVHWFFTLLAFNYVLHRLCKDGMKGIQPIARVKSRNQRNSRAQHVPAQVS